MYVWGCEESLIFCFLGLSLHWLFRYITATALGKLGHPDGELNLTRAAGREGLIQMVPTLASCAFDEIVRARVPGQTQWFQLYVNSDRAKTEMLVRRAEANGMTGLFVTVDAPQLGRREKDMRLKLCPFSEFGLKVTPKLTQKCVSLD